MTDPRLAVVANILRTPGTNGTSSWALAKAQDVLVALDNFHNHDQRFAIGWDDETDEPE